MTAEADVRGGRRPQRANPATVAVERRLHEQRENLTRLPQAAGKLDFVRAVEEGREGLRGQRAEVIGEVEWEQCGSWRLGEMMSRLHSSEE